MIMGTELRETLIRVGNHRRQMHRYPLSVKARALQLRATGMSYRDVAAAVGVLYGGTIRTWLLKYLEDQGFFNAINQAIREMENDQ